MTAYEWQPIETAPKDGTAVLLWIAGRQRVAIGLWNTQEYLKRPKPHWDWSASSYTNHLYAPSHWLPLPAPPEG
jgi:hypothetical protein